MDQSLTITEHRHVQECKRGPTRENSLKQQESLDLTSLQECALETTVSNFPPDLQKQIQKLQSRTSQKILSCFYFPPKKQWDTLSGCKK